MITIVAMVPKIASLPSLMFPLSLCFYLHVQRYFMMFKNLFPKDTINLPHSTWTSCHKFIVFIVNSTFFS